jgi:hypothetical protein
MSCKWNIGSTAFSSSIATTMRRWLGSSRAFTSNAIAMTCNALFVGALPLLLAKLPEPASEPFFEPLEESRQAITHAQNAHIPCGWSAATMCTPAACGACDRVPAQTAEYRRRPAVHPGAGAADPLLHPRSDRGRRCQSGWPGPAPSASAPPVVNPKNLPLAAAAGATIGQGQISTGQRYKGYSQPSIARDPRPRRDHRR